MDEFSTVSNFALLRALHHPKVTLRPPLSYPWSESLMCVRCATGPAPKLENKGVLFYGTNLKLTGGGSNELNRSTAE